MQYRLLGNTGLEVSEIALGCEGFLGKSDAVFDEMFSLALDAGVNFMDLYSPDPTLHRRVGQAVRGKGDFLLQANIVFLL